jgi:hypothetical protein
VVNRLCICWAYYWVNFISSETRTVSYRSNLLNLWNTEWIKYARYRKTKNILRLFNGESESTFPKQTQRNYKKIDRKVAQFCRWCWNGTELVVWFDRIIGLFRLKSKIKCWKGSWASIFYRGTSRLCERGSTTFGVEKWPKWFPWVHNEKWEKQKVKFQEVFHF